MKRRRNRLIIIADDLTGAMDASGSLATQGLPVTVHLKPEFDVIDGVNVINSDSRSDPAGVAYGKLADIAKDLKGETIFKKIDSTLRGNVAVEVKAILDTLSIDKAIICPAFPANGRTVVNGVLLVRGTPVSQTEFSRDPVTPVRESFIPALFERPAGIIPLEDISKGADFLSSLFGARQERILVCDATEQRHLENIVKAAILIPGPFLLCGSSGLARETGILVGDDRLTGAKSFTSGYSGPVLLVVGSRHSASATQLSRAQNEVNLAVIKLETGSLIDPIARSGEISRLTREAENYLKKGVSVAVTSAFSTYLAKVVGEIPLVLAEVTRTLLSLEQVGGLFLSGGETAMAVCKKLNVLSIRVYNEIEPGVPAGEIIFDNLRLGLVTKAGGFGQETVIVNSIRFLERGKV